MKNIKPITPEEVEESQTLPDTVLAVWNELITKNYRNGKSVVKQNEAVNALVDVLLYPRQSIFDKGYLDIEGVYRKAGWVVEYDKPAYNESYEATFTFKRLKR
jgi:hypothetical protein